MIKAQSAVPPQDEQPIHQNIRLSPATADYIAHLARKREESVHQFLNGLIERVIAKERARHARVGRKRTPIEERPVCQSVRLSPATADYVCRLALKRQESVYSLLGGIIERVIAKQRIPPSPPSCYPTPSIPLSRSLSDSSPSTDVSAHGPVSSVLGRR